MMDNNLTYYKEPEKNHVLTPHPSGIVLASQNGSNKTDKLNATLVPVEIRVMDSNIIGDAWLYSFTEHGRIGFSGTLDYT